MLYSVFINPLSSELPSRVWPSHVAEIHPLCSNPTFFGGLYLALLSQPDLAWLSLIAVLFVILCTATQPRQGAAIIGQLGLRFLSVTNRRHESAENMGENVKALGENTIASVLIGVARGRNHHSLDLVIGIRAETEDDHVWACMNENIAKLSMFATSRSDAFRFPRWKVHSCERNDDAQSPAWACLPINRVQASPCPNSGTSAIGVDVWRPSRFHLNAFECLW